MCSQLKLHQHMAHHQHLMSNNISLRYKVQKLNHNFSEVIAATLLEITALFFVRVNNIEA